MARTAAPFSRARDATPQFPQQFSVRVSGLKRLYQPFRPQSGQRLRFSQILYFTGPLPCRIHALMHVAPELYGGPGTRHAHTTGKRIA
jgi:hypothetical protein